MNPYFRVIQALNEHQVRYVVVGGFAGIVHGHDRATKDIDIVVDLDPNEARKAIAALTSIGLQSRVPVDPYQFADPVQRKRWMQEKNAVVFTMIDLNNPKFVVDLFLQEPMELSGFFARAQTARLWGQEFKVCSLDDLIEMKEKAGRPQDLVDIQVLRLIKLRRQET